MNAPASNSLYILSGEYLAIANKLSDSDMPPEVIADTLESLSGELEEKCTNVALFVRNLEATAESIKAAEQQMADRRKAIENKAAGIRQYLKANMQRTGINKIECPYFAITLKKNPPSVIIDDASLLPPDYMVTPAAPPPAPDKELIKKAILDGYEVPGAHIEQGERLDIK